MTHTAHSVIDAMLGEMEWFESSEGSYLCPNMNGIVRYARSMHQWQFTHYLSHPSEGYDSPKQAKAACREDLINRLAEMLTGTGLVVDALNAAENAGLNLVITPISGAPQ